MCVSAPTNLRKTTRIKANKISNCYDMIFFLSHSIQLLNVSKYSYVAQLLNTLIRSSTEDTSRQCVLLFPCYLLVNVQLFI